ncbi:hypothetical protein J5X84_38135 [Streptosporangiaceae bacterium NEAU-GS5]|nr:hypothetical protein [Streptosporangiaceae bacterium NEAU-GS5]
MSYSVACPAALPADVVPGCGRTPGTFWSQDDAQLATMLVTTWALQTGRIPPRRPPDQLSAEELIEFWADDAWAAVTPDATANSAPITLQEG